MPERRNPLYLLLLLAGLVFVLTALAVALVPVLEQKAIDAGNPPPPSEFRDALRVEGWKWLISEVVVVIALAIASMVWDSRRSLQNAPGQATITGDTPPTHPAGAGHGQESDRNDPIA
jgi:uncharacterized membrane protein YqjE